MENKVTVWEFDDLWEEGYRFNNIIDKSYCFVDDKYAGSVEEAMRFLITAYDFIPKVITDDKSLSSFQYIDAKSVVIIENNKDKFKIK